MGPIREAEDAIKTCCPMKFGLMPGTNRNCEASGCAAWKAISDTTDEPVGMEPSGHGWVRNGAPYGNPDGAVSHRQSWIKYTKGACAMMKG